MLQRIEKVGYDSINRSYFRCAEKSNLRNWNFEVARDVEVGWAVEKGKTTLGSGQIQGVHRG